MRWALAFVLMLCVATLWTGLRRVGPIDAREARDAEVARQLIVQREPLTPLLGAEPFFDKPLLAYAPDVVARVVARRHPLAASRAWRAIAAMLLVALTGSLGARHLGGRAGVAAAAVLASSLGLMLAARVDGTQLLATLLGWVAIHGFTDAWFGRARARDGELAIAYGALGCVLAGAGPAPALWPIGAALLYRVLARPVGGLGALRIGVGLAVLAGLALPWYGAAIERNGGALLARAWAFPYGADRYRLIGRFLALSYLAVGFYPWSALLPGAFQHAATWWRRRRPPVEGVPPDLAPLARELSEEHAAHWFIACAAGALLPVLVYPQPPLTAVLPALPALALLCGRLLDHVMEDPARVAGPVVRGTQLLALTATALALLLVVLGRSAGVAAHAVNALATVAFVTGWLPFLAAFTGRLRLAATLMTLPLLAGAPVATLVAVPAFEDYLGTRHAVFAFRRAAPPLAPLVLVEDPPPSLRLLAQHDLVQAGWLAPGWTDARAADGWIYLAFRPGRERDVARSAPGPLAVLDRTPSLVVARVR